MGRKPSKARRVLRRRDLDHSKSAVLNSLGSPASRRVYDFAIDEFIGSKRPARPHGQTAIFGKFLAKSPVLRQLQPRLFTATAWNLFSSRVPDLHLICLGSLVGRKGRFPDLIRGLQPFLPAFDIAVDLAPI